MSELNLDEEIRRIATETLSDGMIEDIIREQLHTAIKASLERSLSYGALSNAITKKIESTMIPQIEKFDMNKYIPKLDTILTEVVNTTRCSEAKKILSNFKTLVAEPQKDIITLDELFESYCDYAAKNCDTDSREVSYESGTPEYEAFECRIDTEDISAEYSIYEKINVDLFSDIEPEYDDTLNMSITLYRTKDKNEDYRVAFDGSTEIHSLARMSDFQAYLTALSQAGVKIKADSVKDMSDFVTPEKEPEITYE